MPSFIIPGIYPEVLQNTSGTPVPDDALSIIGIVGTFARGPLQTPTAVSDPSQAALIFGDADNLSNPNFLTGMWAVYEAMNQGAKQVVIVRVGNAQLATLNLLDFVTDTTAAAVTANVAPQAVLMTGNPLTEGFTVGQTVHIGGVGPEDVVLTAVTATTISAIFTANHLGGVSVTQQALVASVAAPTPGTFGNSYTVQVAAGSQPNTVKLLVTGDGKSETWDNLTMTPGTSRYLPTYERQQHAAGRDGWRVAEPACHPGADGPVRRHQRAGHHRCRLHRRRRAHGHWFLCLGEPGREPARGRWPEQRGRPHRDGRAGQR